MRGVDALMLRFGFMDESLGPAHSLNFLKSLERELEAYIQILRVYFGKHKADMPLSGRLSDSRFSMTVLRAVRVSPG